MDRLSGGCLCASVRFEISAPLQGAVYCHCTRCQRRTGSAYSVSAMTEPGSFVVTRGAELVRTYRPDDGGWLKSWCSGCGSHLFASDPEAPERIVVRLGAIDGDPGVRPRAHQFVDYAAAWAELPDDGLPRHPERLAWK